MYFHINKQCQMLEQDFFANQPENTDRLPEDRKINDQTTMPTLLPREPCYNMETATALRVSLQSFSIYRHANDGSTKFSFSLHHQSTDHLHFT